MEDPQELLDVWFGDWDDHSSSAHESQNSLWWGKSVAVDEMLRERFLDAHWVAARGEQPTDSPARALANILLLDQVPRNVFRATPHMFATDGLALNASRELQDGPMWSDVPFIHRYFALMPMMHSEDLAVHDVALAQFRALADATQGLEQRAYYASAVEFEIKHRVIIERFARYPHRNAVVGRTCTPEETAFLQGPDSSF